MLLAASALIVAIALCCALPAPRALLLRNAGRALVAEDPLQPADLIVIAADAEGAGVLEAADLVRAGFASRVALFADPPDRTDREFIRRGAPWYDAAALSARQLRALGVADIETIPRAVAGTEDEGTALPSWCDQGHYTRIIFVAVPDHSRRVRRVLRRAMHGHPTTVIVRYSHYSLYDPEHWWTNRFGVRTEIVEFEKLLLDLVRHPLP